MRLAIPLLAQRLSESRVLVAAMLGSGAVFAVYALVQSAGVMSGCAVLPGLTPGSVQPMIMTTLHQIRPHGRTTGMAKPSRCAR